MSSTLAIIAGVILLAVVVGLNLFRMWDGNQMYLRSKKAKTRDKIHQGTSDQSDSA